MRGVSRDYIGGDWSLPWSESVEDKSDRDETTAEERSRKRKQSKDHLKSGFIMSIILCRHKL